MFWLLALLTPTVFYTVVNPDISLLQPNGIRFSYPDDGSVNLVAFHYTINKLLPSVDVGQYNYDVTTTTGGYFVHENYDVTVAAGDTVYYWVNVITDTGGYNLLDQSWTAVSGKPVDPVPEPATTTEAPTTKQATTTVKTTIKPPTTDPDNNNTVPPPSSGCSSYPCASSCDQTLAPCNGLIFEELFDILDEDRWQHEITMGGGGNWEFQHYTNNRSNSYVHDNTLFVKPTLTSDHYGEAFLSSGSMDIWGGSPADECTGNAYWGCFRTGSASNYLNPIQSARLRSVNSFSFKYGTIEVVAKMPKGDWIWPAIWMLPKNNNYGSWPASGEIDILESRGNSELKDSNGVSHGNDAVGMTMHWGPFWPLNGYERTTVEKHGSFSDDFHKFTVEWTADDVKFSIDDEQLMNVDPGSDGFWGYGEFEKQAPGIENPWRNSKNKMGPFDKEFYFLINVAVGGTNGFFQDTWSGNKPWNNNSPTAAKDFWMAKDTWYPTWTPEVNNGENAALQVKSIRVWKK